MGNEQGFTTGELVLRLRNRRRAILGTLPKEVRREFLRLGKLIKTVLDEERRRQEEMAADPFSDRAGSDPFTWPRTAEESLRHPTVGGQPVEPLFPDSGRVPLSVHKRALVAFLREHGPASREEIAAKTGIPAGSLSALLRRRGVFEKVKRGVWKLKPLAPPAAPPIPPPDADEALGA